MILCLFLNISRLVFQWPFFYVSVNTCEVPTWLPSRTRNDLRLSKSFVKKHLKAVQSVFADLTRCELNLCWSLFTPLLLDWEMFWLLDFADFWIPPLCVTKWRPKTGMILALFSIFLNLSFQCLTTIHSIIVVYSFPHTLQPFNNPAVRITSYKTSFNWRNWLTVDAKSDSWP